MLFDWDENKAKINLDKHQVSFDEATSVFDDHLFLISAHLATTKERKAYESEL